MDLLTLVYHVSIHVHMGNTGACAWAVGYAGVTSWQAVGLDDNSCGFYFCIPCIPKGQN